MTSSGKDVIRRKHGEFVASKPRWRQELRILEQEAGTLRIFRQARRFCNEKWKNPRVTKEIRRRKNGASSAGLLLSKEKRGVGKITGEMVLLLIREEPAGDRVLILLRDPNR